MTAALLPLRPELEQRLAGSPLVVMLDVDGTLAPIAPRPEEATVPQDTRRAVAALAARDDTRVVLVSGRSAADARRMVAVGAAWVVGNHGCEVVDPEGEVTIEPSVAPYGETMKRAATLIAGKVRGLDGVLVENKTWTISVHYRLANQSIVPRLRGWVEEIARQHGLRTTEGKAVIEIRPPVTVHKGTAVAALAQRLGGSSEGASLLFAGDDRTDEDAFELLRERYPSAVTIRVGDQPMSTAAEFVVSGPEEMREFLEWLARRQT